MPGCPLIAPACTASKKAVRKACGTTICRYNKDPSGRTYLRYNIPLMISKLSFCHLSPSASVRTTNTTYTTCPHAGTGETDMQGSPRPYGAAQARDCSMVETSPSHSFHRAGPGIVSVTWQTPGTTRLLLRQVTLPPPCFPGPSFQRHPITESHARTLVTHSIHAHAGLTVH